MERYRSLNSYFREKFGAKVYKLALGGGMTCPNRDGTLGTGGCIFCSAGGSGEFAESPCGDVARQIARAKKRIAEKSGADKFVAYFQSYTNTYAPVGYLEKLFRAAIEEPSVVALSVGTRPDCLPPDVLALLEKMGSVKPLFVELGLQTTDERTAKLIRRGYPLSVYDRAVKDLKLIGANVVVHTILGLPGENRETMLETVRYVGRSGADGIKIQLLHVLRGTELEKMYAAGLCKALGLEEYVALLGDCLELLPPDIVIHRLTGDAPKKLLIAPAWSADKKRVLNAVSASFEKRNIVQGSRFTP